MIYIRRPAVLLLMLGCFVQFASSQQSASLNQATTFTSPDGAFSVSYPTDFQFCKRGGTEPCVQSYIPVCDDDVIVCVVYFPPEFKNTNFAAAAFQVREITRMEDMRPNVCVTPYPRKDGNVVSEWPEFQVSAEHPIENIEGVQFLHGVSGGAATSHWLSTDLYRAFHNKRCFELAINQTGTEPHVTDPPMKTLTAVQQKMLDRTMSNVLHSFRFLK
jgi:hypothetical protein